MDLIGEICLYLDSQPSKDVESILAEYKVSLNIEESVLLAQVAEKHRFSHKKWSELLYSERQRVSKLESRASQLGRRTAIQFMQIGVYRELEKYNWEVWKEYKRHTSVSTPYFAALINAKRRIHRKDELKARRFTFKRTWVAKNTELKPFLLKAERVQKLLVFRFLLVLKSYLDHRSGTVEQELTLNSAFLPVIHALSLERQADRINEIFLFQLLLRVQRSIIKECPTLELGEKIVVEVGSRVNGLIERENQAKAENAMALITTVSQRQNNRQLVETDSIAANTLQRAANSTLLLQKSSETAEKHCFLNLLFKVHESHTNKSKIELNQLEIPLMVKASLERKKNMVSKSVNRRKSVFLMTRLIKTKERALNASKPECKSISTTLLNELSSYINKNNRNCDLIASEMSRLFAVSGLELMSESNASLKPVIQLSNLKSKELIIKSVLNWATKIDDIESRRFKQYTFEHYLLQPKSKLKTKQLKVKTLKLSEKILTKMLSSNPKTYSDILNEQTAAVLDVLLMQTENKRMLSYKCGRLRNVVYNALVLHKKQTETEKCVANQIRTGNLQAITRNHLDKCLHNEFQLQTQLEKARRKCTDRVEGRLSYQILQRWKNPNFAATNDNTTNTTNTTLYYD